MKVENVNEYFLQSFQFLDCVTQMLRPCLEVYNNSFAVTFFMSVAENLNYLPEHVEFILFNSASESFSLMFSKLKWLPGFLKAWKIFSHFKGNIIIAAEVIRARRLEAMQVESTFFLSSYFLSHYYVGIIRKYGTSRT